MKWVILIVGVILGAGFLGLVALGGLLSLVDTADEELPGPIPASQTMGTSTSEDAPANDSASDPWQDVTIDACPAEEFGMVTIPLTVVNNSTGRSDYWVELILVSPEGVQIGEALGTVTNLDVGSTAITEAVGTVPEGSTGYTCELVDVERTGSL